MTTFEYLDTEETNRRRELAYGVVREPPAPFFSHQTIVLRVARLLADHVEPRQLGHAGVSPIDVILDADRDLIVQPDVLFVSIERVSIIRNQLWGAPDLVVEVLSAGTESYDRQEKLGWYRQYGVREYWLVDPSLKHVIIIDFTSATPERRVIDRLATIRSSVLPLLDAPVSRLFD